MERIARHYPESAIDQLPYHITILDNIRSSVTKEVLSSKIGESLKFGKFRPFKIVTRNVSIWHNDKYGGNTIALSVNKNLDLMNLRHGLIEYVKPVSDEQSPFLWKKYRPHITITLCTVSASKSEFRNWRKRIVLSFAIDSFALLLHGGKYHGYTKVRDYFLNESTSSPNEATRIS